MISVYNIWDRSGIKGFVIPGAHKPAPLNISICEVVAKLIKRADEYIARQDAHVAARTASARSIPQILSRGASAVCCLFCAYNVD